MRFQGADGAIVIEVALASSGGAGTGRVVGFMTACPDFAGGLGGSGLGRGWGWRTRCHGDARVDWRDKIRTMVLLAIGKIDQN